jgi:hypothetical protein
MIELGQPFDCAIRATPAQLHGLGFYPRDDKGSLKRPAPSLPPESQRPAPSLALDLAALEAFRGYLSAEKYEAARAALLARHAEGTADAV